MWYEESVFYQIYPLGFCGAPAENDQIPVSRIHKIADWEAHIKALGADALYLGPVLESDRHGYDTRDYFKIDTRLGTNADFKAVCRHLHQSGIRIILDGVFNHVGRGFWAFQDVLKNREHSPYLHWFHIDLNGDNGYQDGLWYEGWEGHFELVKLNLQNPEVSGHLLSAVKSWMEDYEIDGLRLDVAYMLDRDFLRQLHDFTKGIRADFFLLGEMIHGDYNQIVNPQMLDSCTNYECAKGLYSSFNQYNLFEIAHSLNRQFGPEQWTLYRGKHLMCFVDNHDINRIASVLENPSHLPLIYGLLFAMPGIPCIYYGSEWGLTGEKEHGGDIALRPCPEHPEFTELTGQIAAFAKVHSSEPALCCGEYHQISLSNRQFVFLRRFEGQEIFIAVNIDGQDFEAHSDAFHFSAENLLDDRRAEQFDGRLPMPAYSVAYWKKQG